MKKRLTVIYFSPTGGTKKAATYLADNFTDFDTKYIDYTLSKNRKDKISFSEEELIIVASPVYAGQIPQIKGIFDNIYGHTTPCIIMACYGNRAYDDALAQMQNILEKQGFIVIGAVGAVIPHIFSDKLGNARPNIEDRAVLNDFAKNMIVKIKENNINHIDVTGDPAPELKKPIFVSKTFDENRCTMCGACIALCPVEAISSQNMEGNTNVCISCMRCVKYCPVNARSFNNDKITKWLESNFIEPKKVKTFE